MTTLSKLFSALLLFPLLLNTAQAAGMRPEVPALFLDDGGREATINVQNTDSSLALLHSSLQTIPEDRENLLIITPQLARVNAGQKQQVRVMLKQGVMLDKQRMQRINFISVPQDNGKQNRTRILIGQNIPVIISPASLPQNLEPWKLLKWQRNGQTIQVENPSKYIVRMTDKIDLLPSKNSISLKKTYLLPGEKVLLSLKESDASKIKEIRIHPVTRFGVLTTPYVISL
ncbi:fimbria/pilus chaperone family protein [Pantoea sp. BAV 3049]|uniref:fimbria/pilus chaperone family protein n=1 Tax=Pantoea sp. BAV 3049 TaxID=2654188 RepID=UPI00131B2704|nr:fimbria/pilus chaperone family protein [Pantoea sp. BAV 3049]